jgi:hypothetical protein
VSGRKTEGSLDPTQIMRYFTSFVKLLLTAVCFTLLIQLRIVARRFVVAVL